MTTGNPELDALLKRATAKWDKMTPTERAIASMRSRMGVVRAEMLNEPLTNVSRADVERIVDNMEPALVLAELDVREHRMKLMSEDIRKMRSRRLSDPLPEHRKFVEGTVGLVNASDYEMMSLWRYHNEGHGVDWKENLCGMFAHVGTVGESPVHISMQSAVVSGYKLIFWDATSITVDYTLIDGWFSLVMPDTAYHDKALNQVNAMNFPPRGVELKQGKK